MPILIVDSAGTVYHAATIVWGQGVRVLHKGNNVWEASNLQGEGATYPATATRIFTNVNDRTVTRERTATSLRTATGESTRELFVTRSSTQLATSIGWVTEATKIVGTVTRWRTFFEGTNWVTQITTVYWHTIFEGTIWNTAVRTATNWLTRTATRTSALTSWFTNWLTRTRTATNWLTKELCTVTNWVTRTVTVEVLACPTVCSPPNCNTPLTVTISGLTGTCTLPCGAYNSASPYTVAHIGGCIWRTAGPSGSIIEVFCELVLGVPYWVIQVRQGAATICAKWRRIDVSGCPPNGAYTWVSGVCGSGAASLAGS